MDLYYMYCTYSIVMLIVIETAFGVMRGVPRYLEFQSFSGLRVEFHSGCYLNLVCSVSINIIPVCSISYWFWDRLKFCSSLTVMLFLFKFLRKYAWSQRMQVWPSRSIDSRARLLFLSYSCAVTSVFSSLVSLVSSVSVCVTCCC